MNIIPTGGKASVTSTPSMNIFKVYVTSECRGEKNLVMNFSVTSSSKGGILAGLQELLYKLVFYSAMEHAAENFHLQLKNTNGISNLDGLHHLDDIHHRDTPPAGSLPYSRPGPALPKLSTMSEGMEDEELEDSYDNELSVEAQAHNISMFLSSSNSDSGKFV